MDQFTAYIFTIENPRGFTKDKLLLMRVYMENERSDA